MSKRPTNVDTVSDAIANDKEQPWKELGLKEDEYQSLREILGRRPTSSELAMYSVMWSEHCSYKSSKIYPVSYTHLTLPTKRIV